MPLLLAAVVFARTSAPEIPPSDAVRIRGFDRLAACDSEGLLLDRLRPNGGTAIFGKLYTLDAYFENQSQRYAKINPGGNGQVLAWLIHRDSFGLSGLVPTYSGHWISEVGCRRRVP
ncbi:MAG: hypothetical protein AUG46_03500 [Acidobacteria bacterium 13_1_20CM_3_58_11]|nr:MAG: hypothetical protein AUG46_03500 [Acidobacteria bacterium 13_1_20CM_3_58_11]